MISKFYQIQFFQVFYDDCAFPLEFAYYMFAHAFIFFVMFAHFYINAYLTPKTKLKVIKWDRWKVLSLRLPHYVIPYLTLQLTYPILT